MKVTALIENQCEGEYLPEHGLSILIEYNHKMYLLDTGASGYFALNAKDMGIDQANIDIAFLSHAHYDHSGGYNEFFKANKTAIVYLQKAAKQEHFYKIVDIIKKDIGIPGGVLKYHEDRFVYVDGDAQIDEGVSVLAHHTPNLSDRGKRAHMYAMEEGRLVVDEFKHEQTVVFEENGELVIFNSCSHGGIDNVIAEVQTAYPGKNIKAFFGGFHLMGTLGYKTCSYTKEEVQELGKKLVSMCDTVFYTGHCTGIPAFEYLSEVMNEQIHTFHTGDVVEV